MTSADLLPTPRAPTAATYDGTTGRIYILGGQMGVYLDDILQFDPLTGAVSDIANLQRPVALQAAAHVGDYSYTFGGITTAGGANVATNWIFRYDPALNVSVDRTPIVALPATLFGAQAVSDGTSAYLLGGCKGGDYCTTNGPELVTSDVLRFDPGASTVTKVGDLPAKVVGHASVYDGDRYIYSFGGNNTGLLGGQTAAITRYDIETNSSATLGCSLPNARSFGSAVWDGDRAYYFGGNNATGLLSQIVKFEPGNGTSCTVTIMARALESPRESVSSVWSVGKRRAYIFGGRTLGGPVDDVVTYFPIPAAPKPVTATRTDTTTCTVIWTPPASNTYGALTEYNIYRMTNGATILVGSVSGSTTTFHDTTAVHFATHYYFVAGKNGPDEGDRSALDPC